MTDNFASYTSNLNSPSARAAPIAPADGVALSQTTRAVYVGQGGDLRVRMMSGDVVTLTATGTSAGALVGLY